MKNKEKQPKTKRKRRPVDKKYMVQIKILASFSIIWCIILVLWVATVIPLDEYNPDVKSPDGISTTDVKTDEDSWSGAVGADYTELPEIIDGFGDTEKAVNMTYFGKQSYSASTTVYVITKQNPSELGIDKNKVTDDGEGYFSWTEELNGCITDIGNIDISQSLENLNQLYAEDCERLKDYLEDKGYYWYTITYRTNSEDIVSKSDCGIIVKDIFGMKLDPSRSKILYSGGYKYISGES